MSSIMRRRSGLISVIGGLPFQGWGAAPKPWQTEHLKHSATAHRFSRVSGLVQSVFTIHRNTHLGLAYGEQPRERLNLVLAGNPTAPTLAYIHGVYWQMTQQTKELYSALAEGAVSHGLNVAIVEYTLAPEARMDRIVGEVRHAISWLHEHLGDYGADPGRIYVAGHSAGGHLTAMTMPLGEVR